MKGRITEKGKAVVELMEHEGISLEEALERIGPPAGLGDATRPDPAMIERLAEIIATDCSCKPCIASARERARAAAGVIVPATVEAIATAQEATQVNNAPQFAAIARSFTVPDASHD